jgi:flagellin
MPLGVLNNIAAIYAENNLNQTQASLQNVLTQLSSGSRLNSGADDPAGLSIANGLAANSAALTQSSHNASEGVGFLQVADGALAQVTSLLTSAITLATEAAGGTLSTSQMSAADQEYQDIMTQIGTIGSTTEYNGIQVFSADQTVSALTWGANAPGVANSAAATASAVAASNIVAGGTTAGTAPTVTSSYGAGAAITWTKNAGSTTLTTDAIPVGSQLGGTLTFSATVNSAATPTSVDLADVTGNTLAAEATSLAALLNTAAGFGHNDDYAVTVVGGNTLQISLGAGANGDQITAVAAPTVSGTAAAPTGLTMTVADGDTLGGTLTVAPAGSGAGSPVAIDLDGTTTANLVSTINTALGEGAADYTVAYSEGTLSIGLSGQAATDNITGFSQSGALTQAASKDATITFTDGDTLGGNFSITPTIGGSAGSAVTVNLAGVTTANLVSTVNAALGSAASDYSVSYASGTGKLTIGVSAQGVADNVNSIAIANGGGGNALSQGTFVESGIVAVNSLMGNFLVTPTTAAGPGTAVNINLQGVATSSLASTLQADLGTNYLVSYTGGELNLSISSAGVAAGITGFTAAEASEAAASQDTPITGGVDIYTGDGTTGGSQNYNVTVGALSEGDVGTSVSNSVMGVNITATVGNVTGTGGIKAGAGQGTSMAGTNLTSQASAEAALQTADDAITAIAYQRGQVGANINTLNAASNIASSQQTNITAAQNTIMATDYASATSNMSKYEILTQTGISALAQANSTQQMVTKLLGQ